MDVKIQKCSRMGNTRVEVRKTFNVERIFVEFV